MNLTRHWRGRNDDDVDKDEAVWHEKVTDERIQSFASNKSGKGVRLSYPGTEI